MVSFIARSNGTSTSTQGNRFPVLATWLSDWCW